MAVKYTIYIKIDILIRLVLYREVSDLVTISVAVIVCCACINVIASAEVAEGGWSGVHVEQLR